MYNKLFTLILVAGACLSAHLPAGPDPIEWAEREEAKMKQNQLSRRQIPWYLPVIAVPQVVEVHHVIILQSPETRCFPPRIPPTPPASPPTPGQMDDGLEGRMGGGGGGGGQRNVTATEPSRCVWAIVACCAPGSTSIRYTCFELLGCQGAFWDVNPCDNRVVMAAANTALRFYMNNNTAPSGSNNNINDISSNLTQ
uniref:Putative conserved secreted protein n=1 Tax=Panstrongylus lignarius TaxID=156445 RepID=A0A224XY62_9HEMI